MHRIVVLATALALGACAGPGLLGPAAEFEFELTGRIAVHSRDEASSGNFAWRHRANGDELLITSALGQGIARLEREGAEVRLVTAEAREYRAADAESLTEQVLGYRLPLAGLADWVRARPAPGTAAARRDAHGRLVELEQSGWRIEYLDYAAGRPTRMRLIYRDLELRLAISEWK